MRTGAILGGLILGLAASTAHAAEFDVNLSDEAARINLSEQVTTTGLHVDGGWLHDDDDGDVLSAGALLVDDAAAGRGALNVGVGAKLFYVDFDAGNADGSAVGLGGRFRYTWPSYNRFGIGGHAWYAPDVTASGDIEGYYEAAVSAEYLVLRNANAYIGLRAVRIKPENGGTETFESGPHVGLRLKF